MERRRTVSDVWQDLRNTLVLKYGDREGESMASRVMEHLAGLTRMDIFLNPEKVIPGALDLEITNMARQLLNDIPLQHITGLGHFYGRDFKVGPEVLIPRRETEELVSWVVLDLGGQYPGSILDIGTGSGSIAVTLALELPRSTLTGIDISTAALGIAKENAEKHGARVAFALADILDASRCKQLGAFDVLVSNPPYVRDSEKGHMPANVIGWDPDLALFVPDDDPLIYYRNILDFAVDTAGSEMVFFEINEAMEEQLTRLIGHYPVKFFEFRKDMQGKARMLKITF